MTFEQWCKQEHISPTSREGLVGRRAYDAGVSAEKVRIMAELFPPHTTDASDGTSPSKPLSYFFADADEHAEPEIDDATPED